MAIQFTLGFGGIGSYTPLEIASEEFYRLKTHANIVRHAISLEEKYDIVLGSYVDLERTLLTLSIEHMLQSQSSLVWMSSSRRRINQHFMAFLSLTKTYFDHGRRHAAGVFGKRSVEYEAYLQREKNCSDFLPHRIMNQVRNHAQHFDFPVHEIWYGASKLDGGKSSDDNLFAHTITMYLSAKEASLDRDFGALLPEIEAAGGKIDLRKCSAEFLDSLSQFHFQTRATLTPMTELALAECRSAIRRFREVGEENQHYAVHAIAFNPEEQRQEVVPMADRFFEYLEELQQSRDQAVNIGRSVAASRVPIDR